MQLKESAYYQTLENLYRGVNLKTIPLQRKMPVEFVIDNKQQTPVKSYFNSARLLAMYVSDCIYVGDLVTLVLNLVLHPLAY